MMGDLFIYMEKFSVEINQEVIGIFYHLNLFQKLNEVINKNGDLKNKDQTVLSWMRMAFTADLINLFFI